MSPRATAQSQEYTRLPGRLTHALRAGLVAAAAAAMALAPAAASAQAGMNLIRDTEIELILKEYAKPVFEAAGLNPDDVTINLVADRELNAGAAAGQQMFFNTGFIQETENPNQLIGVIAHEAGHIAGGHMVRSGEMNKAGMRPFLLSMGLGLLAIAAGAPDAGAALMVSAPQFGTIGALGYSRQQEGRADQAAATYLERAGISSKGLVDFFDKFRYNEVFSEARRFAFFRSHPISSERIEMLRSRVEAQPAYDKTDSAHALAQHAIIKAKIDAFMDPPTQTFIKYKETDTSFPARYARAIAHYKATHTDLAVTQVDALITEQPDNPYLYELKGQILFEAGRVAESEAPLRRSVELAPQAPLLRVLLAQTLLAQEPASSAPVSNPKLNEAVEHLQKALTIENDNTFAWRLMAQAHDTAGEPGQARLATAEEHYAIGDTAQAKVFAMRARELLVRNSPQWRRATDIVLVSEPTPDDLEALAQERPGQPRS
jgi:predicted Zn-dependent protease